jgi:hypothetical protein
MQQKLVLYIGDVSVYTDQERVDQFKDESVSLTQTIQNVKDIKKIFTEFTQTFSLPASKKNNKIFKHYYNYHISNGFDARKKVKASLELNDIPFKEGKIALTGVDLKKGVPHTYKVTFYGNTVDLKDILGDTQLATLEKLGKDYNTIYNYDNIEAGLGASNTANVIVPLISHTDRLFYDTSQSSEQNGNLWYSGSGLRPLAGVDYQQLKYALRLQTIIEAIEWQFPITFSDDFFTSSNTDWNNLFMWLHRKKGNVEAATPIDFKWTTITELRQYYCSYPNGPCIPNATTNGISIDIHPISSSYVLNSVNVTLSPTQTTTDYSIRIIRNGNESDVVAQRINVQGTTSLGNFYGDPLFPPNNLYTIQVSSASTIIFGQDTVLWSVNFIDNSTSGQGQTAYHDFGNRVMMVTNLDKEFNMAEQIPKMKIIDFLSGVFQMWNLTAYVKDDGEIVVQPLDDYYADGSADPINIDKYLDVNKSTVDIALPFKEVNFSYKGLNTFLAKQYEQLFNSGWGSLSYSANDYFDAPESKYSIEIPFEHMQYERLFNESTNGETTIQYGYFVDDNRESYYGSPLIFYGIRRTTGTSIAVRKVEGDVREVETYWIPSNTKTLDASSSQRAIHFQPQLSEYKAFVNPSDSNRFTNTLFETQYKTYIQEVFNPTVRLTKVTAYLPYKIFSSLKLNDLIQLGQNDYKINSMTTELTTGKTEFELLNIN